MKIKVIIADDHKLVREGVAKLLEAETDIEIVGQAANGLEAVNLCSKLRPDVVLMDISMPVLNGIAVTRSLKSKKNSPRIIIVSTMHDSKQFVQELLEMGADGYLLKSCTIQQIIDAINSVYEGRKYLSKEITDIVIEGYLNPDNNNILISRLTKREKEIFKLYAHGNDGHNIAKKLFLSIKTVTTHKQNILNKMEMKNVMEIIKFAYEFKMFEK